MAISPNESMIPAAAPSIMPSIALLSVPSISMRINYPLGDKIKTPLRIFYYAIMSLKKIYLTKETLWYALSAQAKSH